MAVLLLRRATARAAAGVTCAVAAAGGVAVTPRIRRPNRVPALRHGLAGICFGGAALLLIALAACRMPAARTSGASAPDAAGQHERTLERQVVTDVRARYLVFLPAGYSVRAEPWPLILFLHGAGERGDDLEAVARHGPPRLVRERPDFPFVVVSPQVPTKLVWSTVVLDGLLRDVVEHYKVDPERIYLTGLSMGGYGAWDLAMEFPHRFAAMAPVSGGGVPSGACALKHLPIWVFHGAKDDIVPVDRAMQLVDRLRGCDGDVRLTVYPDAGHDAWTRAYADPALYEWFLRQRRQAPARAGAPGASRPRRAPPRPPRRATSSTAPDRRGVA